MAPVERVSGIGRIAVFIDAIVIASRLDLLLRSRMTVCSVRLPVGARPHELTVAAVSDDVIHHVGKASATARAPTVLRLGQKFLGRAFPFSGVTALAG